MFVHHHHAGIDVVYEMQNLSLFNHRLLWGTVFKFAMMAQYEVLEEYEFLAFDVQFIGHTCDFIICYHYMSNEVPFHCVGSTHRPGQFLYLADIVQDDRTVQKAPVQRRIYVTERFCRPEHIVDMVCKSRHEVMMICHGCRKCQELSAIFIKKLTDNPLQTAVFNLDYIIHYTFIKCIFIHRCFFNEIFGIEAVLFFSCPASSYFHLSLIAVVDAIAFDFDQCLTLPHLLILFCYCPQPCFDFPCPVLEEYRHVGPPLSSHSLLAPFYQVESFPTVSRLKF